MPEALSLYERIEKMRAAVKPQRTTIEPLWRDLDDFVLPDVTQFSLSDANNYSRRASKIIDSTTQQSVRTLQAGLMSGLTSPARPWFRYMLADPELSAYQPVRAWLDDCAEIVAKDLRASNLYTALPKLYANVAVFGVEALVFDESMEGSPFFFDNLPIGSYHLAVNARKRVDTVFYETTMTVRQVVEEFGIDAVSETVRNRLDRGDTEGAVNIVHAVIPNPEVNPGRLPSRFKRFLSVKYEDGCNEKRFLSLRGYDTFPVLCPRWEAIGRNVYGTGQPGKLVLPDTKALQAYERRSAEAAALQVAPPLQAPSALRGKDVQMVPKGLTYVDPIGDGKVGIRPLYDVNFDMQGVELKAAQARDRIQRGLFVDLFLMLANSDRRQITAEEIRAKQEEKLLAIGPVLERLNDELLDPLHDRAFAIELRRGRLPPPPEEIMGMPISVEYLSPLAQAERMLKVGTIDRVMGVAGNLAAIYPEVRDKFNVDKIADIYVDGLGAPSEILRTDEEVAAIRKQRADAQQQAAMAQTAQAQAQTAQVLSQTDTSRSNALTDLVRTQTGVAA